MRRELPKVRLCSGCREEPARAVGQSYCKECNAAAGRKHRAKQKAELARLLQELEELKMKLRGQ